MLRGSCQPEPPGTVAQRTARVHQGTWLGCALVQAELPGDGVSSPSLEACKREGREHRKSLWADPSSSRLIPLAQQTALALCLVSTDSALESHSRACKGHVWIWT